MSIRFSCPLLGPCRYIHAPAPPEPPVSPIEVVTRPTGNESVQDRTAPQEWFDHLSRLRARADAGCPVVAGYLD